MTRAQLTIAAVVVFVLGCSLGLLGGILFARFVMFPPRHAMAGMREGGGPPPFGPPEMEGRPWAGRPPGAGEPEGPPPEHIMRRLSSALQLTPDQRERLRPLLERSRQEFGQVRDSLDARIGRQLEPEQRKRWEEMQNRQRAAEAARRPGQRPLRDEPDEEGGPR